MDKILNCKNNDTHDDLMNKALKNMPDDTTLYYITELFKILGDETRTKILSVLASGELCVCDISKALNMTKSAISHQLKVLRLARLVKAKKIGKEVYYSLDDDHVQNLYHMAIEHVRETK